MNRRHFLLTSLAAALTTTLGAAGKRPRRLLLRSSWQTVNIGDIAHTPGVLALLEKYLPDVEITLWPSKLDNGVEAMLARRFPKLKVVQGDAVKGAMEDCDFLLHGSGASLVAERDVVKWTTATGKPYGIYGITFSERSSAATTSASDAALAETIRVMSAAKFAFFRDSVSLALAKQRGCNAPIMEFCPDSAFATDLRDDGKALAFLAQNQLEAGRFLCCIPRLRYSPYWKMKPGVPLDEIKHARNEAMKEHDLAPLREAIVAVARQTPMKVLVCPEDSSQMELGKTMLVDPLPDDVRARVVWREKYWLTDEALSVYVRSAGLFGAEMHSPIICIGNGIPAIVCRWAEQTSKGMMWRDIGLGDWLFDMDNESEIPGIVPTVLSLAKDPAAAKAKAEKAREFVVQRERETMSVVDRSFS